MSDSILAPPPSPPCHVKQWLCALPAPRPTKIDPIFGGAKNSFENGAKNWWLCAAVFRRKTASSASKFFILLPACHMMHCDKFWCSRPILITSTNGSTSKTKNRNCVPLCERFVYFAIRCFRGLSVEQIQFWYAAKAYNRCFHGPKRHGNMTRNMFGATRSNPRTTIVHHCMHYQWAFQHISESSYCHLLVSFFVNMESYRVIVPWEGHTK